MAFTLCVNCENAPNCIWKSDKTILCNEFLISNINTPQINIVLTPSLENIQPSETAIELCDTCLEQEKCHLRKDTGSIQYCEEFQP